ncbi:MFS transporter [Paenarthrobacter sp. NPDC058040]|uniref:MFS transporter n=1 Tax=unclassified Paenarthrobacter TaxID=2634190 RepID=UPI0036D94E0D
MSDLMLSAKEQQQTLKKAIIGSLVGTTLEWYDFFLYGSAAALVFNKVFFPSFDPVTGTLLAFLTFAMGFVARPLGGVIAGHFGDRIGRKNILLFTISLMGASTVAIGLLPGYDAVGILAPILLIVTRMIQGLALGGEWAGGALMIAERAPDARRGFLTSFVQVGVPIGTLLSTGVLFLMSAIQSNDQFIAWGWRVPFILSVVVVFIGIYIRRQVSESPAFLALEESRTEKPKRPPIVEVFRRQSGEVFKIVGIRAGADIVYYTCVTFTLTYVAQTLGLPREIGLIASLIAAAMQIFTYPAFAALSDKYGRRRITVIGAVGCLAWIFAFFPMLDTKSSVLIVLGVVLGLFFHSAMYGVQASWICELFDTEHRYSGASIGYQLSGIVGGSLAPTISLWLLSTFHSTLSIQIYVGLGCLIVALTALATRETRGTGIQPVAPGKEAE